MADRWLETVESRLDELENRVFGYADKDVSYPKDAEPCIDALGRFNNQLQAAITGRKKIEGTMKKMPDLAKFMDPAYTERLTLSNEAKTEIILAEEDFIRKQAERLEKVQPLTDVLNSEHLKVVPQIGGKFQDLNQIQIEQQDKTADMTDEVKQLLLHYNNIITLLSKQFVQWDDLITNMEIKAQPKQVID